VQLYNLSEQDEKDGVPISGLQVELFPSQSSDPGATKYFVMAATPFRHYQFIGGPTFEAMFERYKSPAFLEVPGPTKHCTLSWFRWY
jgi:hypothetical protein